MSIQALQNAVRHIETNPDQDPIGNIDGLLNQVIQELGRRDLHSRPIAECEALQKVVEFCSSFVKRLAPQDASAEQLQNLKAKVLAAKCGGTVPFEYFRDHADFRRFVEANHLQNKYMTLHTQIDVHQGLPVFQARVGGSYPVDWAHLNKVEVQNDQREVTGFQYLDAQNNVLFETNTKGELTPDYSFNHEGIVHYNIKSPEIRAHDVRNPAEWNREYVLEVWTEVIAPSGTEIQSCLGDHTYLVMKNGQTGEIFSIGNFAKDFEGWDFATPLAHKHISLETPDRFLFVPKRDHSIEKRDVILTQAQFDQMMTRWRKDKANGELIFSAVKNNCTSWCGKVIREELGIDLDSRMPIAEYLLRQLPSAQWKNDLIASAQNFISQLPDFVQKALHFFPLYYIPFVLIGLVAKLLNLGSVDGETDFSLLDILFRPWNIYVDQPLKLRQSLARLADRDLDARNRAAAPQPAPSEA
jgi:hypothetical protein